MEYSLSNSLVGGGGGLNPDKLSLDLPFAITKSLTAAKGPTPTFVRASTGTYFGSDGYLKSAANNVARFDHETSYAGSTVFVQCIDCVDVYSNVFSAAERIPLSGIDGNGYPYFLSSLFSVSYSISTSEWILSYDAGNFEAYSVTGLSDEYIPYGAIGGTANVITELACKGLLIEESSANLATYSKAIVNGIGWGLGGLTSTLASTPVSPDGSSPYEISETENSAPHNFSNSGGSGSAGETSVVTGTAYTGSIFLRKVAGSVDWIQLTMGGFGFSLTPYANFDLSSGTIGNYVGLTSGTLPKIVSCGNGWYRCSITVTAVSTTTTTSNIIVAFTNNTNVTQRAPSYLGSTANKILANMCQFEVKAFPTSYIPTTTGSAPRSADLCSITGAKFLSFYNQLEGSFAASVIFNSPINAVGEIVFDVSDGTLNNRIRSIRGNTGLSQTANTSSGSVNVNIIGSTVMSSNAVMKLSACVKANDFAVYLNNISQGVDTTADMPLSLTTLTIGDVFAAAATKAPLNGCISSIKYYKKRLPNAKLQSLTT